MTQEQAKFVVIEGLEGAGKSSAIELVKQIITQHTQQTPVCTREPGGTPLAEKMRDLVKVADETDPLCDESECLLFYAARAQLIANVIKPALANGTWVLGDRHNLSSLAYQGGGRGLMPLVKSISDITLKGFKPDLTLYLDIEPKLGLARAASRGALDRIEVQQIEFFERARATFLAFAAEDDSIIVIDASKPIEQVHQQITAELTARLA
ncbi:dTMP kinase [Shewanella sp. 1_MG-2023]|uniref:Thymidylate kinase n=1 Tax=Shewanella electrodiphila TaxID=934143 RepID=A0ABT0KP93_9GAMM|nr:MULTISPECIES: dTMP kinase [Shewanella]MCL1045185.1 dTMP kinase [Shewanella electrodiphila]MDO6611827.1 dTMP kinase [Shewanella sp. 7_MG-2023]MDO6771682.1 dTMP kinase [Shewanella sp. 2_MG-2023]MDO6793908.1 dTMP kinase [Shewanella sp. 1_MG-2023]PMG75637.1 dTMP kinase [Shewanella sp. 10N.286.51.B7]